HYVSDCGAIEDIHKNHKVTETAEESAALAVNRGCDLNCGKVYESLKKAIKEGMISEETIDKSVKRLLKARFKLGMFDPEEKVPFSKIPYEVNDSKENRQMALETARQSMVLLKNDDSILPLDKNKIKNIAVIGPNADDKDVLLGNYSGLPSKYTTVLKGIQEAVNDDTRVFYAEGCAMGETPESFWGNPPTTGFAEALSVAERADVVVMCLGLSPKLEGEEGEFANSDGGGDKINLKLPGMQEELLKVISQTGKPIVMVLLNGSPLELNWAEENIPAILEAWYPGEEGGTAIADILFGKYNPGGRLPLTFVKSMEQLPPFRDYSMENRTYRFMKDEPLYPFGYGLSYTDFDYSDLKISDLEINSESGKEINISVTVKNIGEISGDEVVQLYVKDLEASTRVPNYELRGIKRINLDADEKTTVEFGLKLRDLALIDDQGNCILEPGKFQLFIGGQQPDQRSENLTGKKVLTMEIEVSGKRLTMEY
ncbi:MAG: glycoside hydrolase family 3 C-terminal domain-containing protein, partial [bacterium]